MKDEWLGLTGFEYARGRWGTRGERKGKHKQKGIRTYYKYLNQEFATFNSNGDRDKCSTVDAPSLRLTMIKEGYIGSRTTFFNDI